MDRPVRRSLYPLLAIALLALGFAAVAGYVSWRQARSIALATVVKTVQPLAEEAHLAWELERLVADSKLAVNRALGREGGRPGEGETLRDRSQALAAQLPEPGWEETLALFGQQSAALLKQAATVRTLLETLEATHQEALSDLEHLAEQPEAEGTAPQLQIARCRSALLQVKIERIQFSRLLPVEQLPQELVNPLPPLFSALHDGLTALRSGAPERDTLVAAMEQRSFAYEDRLNELYAVLSRDMAPLLTQQHQEEEHLGTVLHALEVRMDAAAEDAARQAREELHGAQ